MKKGLIILSTAIYLLLSIGIAKSTHMCMGREMSVELFSLKAEGCFTMDDRKMPCCEDVLERLSVEDKHVKKAFDLTWTNTFTIIEPIILLDIHKLQQNQKQQIITDLPDPPDITEEPIYISTSSFTYYG